MTTRWDETWHRLREWTNGQASSERLAAQILFDDGYKSLDPTHPLGGKDGGKDAVCFKDGRRWIMAAYFPRGQQPFAAIKSKFVGDLGGVAKNQAVGIAFVTNQEMTEGERGQLREVALGSAEVDLFHLERLTAVLDKPGMVEVRRQFLRIDYSVPAPSDGWASALPSELKNMVSLELTTPPLVSRYIARSDDGQFWIVLWDSMNARFRWSKATEEYAEQELPPVARSRNLTDWRQLFDGPRA